jgi:activating signal cointegrator complex subunit 3
MSTPTPRFSCALRLRLSDDPVMFDVAREQLARRKMMDGAANRAHRGERKTNPTSTNTPSSALTWSSFSLGIDASMPSFRRKRKEFSSFVADIVQCISGVVSPDETAESTSLLYALMADHSEPPDALTPIFGIIDLETWRSGRTAVRSLQEWHSQAAPEGIGHAGESKVTTTTSRAPQEYTCGITTAATRGQGPSWEHLLTLPPPCMLPAQQVRDPSPPVPAPMPATSSSSSAPSTTNTADASAASSTIDARWLLLRCEHHLASLGSAALMAPKELGKSLLDAVQSSKSDEGKLQADLFNLLGENGFDLLLQIFEHREALARIRSLNDADKPDAKARVGRGANGMFARTGENAASGSSQGGIGVQVSSSGDRQTAKNIKRERRKLKRKGLTDAEIDQALFGKADEQSPSSSPSPSSKGQQYSGGQSGVHSGAGAGGGFKNMTRALPSGTKRTVHDKWEEVIVPAAGNPPPTDIAPPVPIAALPDWAQLAFRGMPQLNRLQSKVYKTAFETSENLLICAPTGAGKTNVAMLSVLHCMASHMEDGVILPDKFKIIYVCPMKALAAEITSKFGSRLRPLGIRVAELTGDTQMSKTEIARTQMLVVTPEKWDVITRKQGGDGTLVSKVKLLIIDEVHLLADERGPVIETLVARTLRQIETTQRLVRIVGLSATLPNYKDVATFLRVGKGLFYFDRSWRPVPLQMGFAGISVGKSQVKQRAKMNEIAYEKCADALSRGRQVLIFVHSRKETAKTAQAIAELARKDGRLDLFTVASSPADAGTGGESIPNAPKQGQSQRQNGGGGKDLSSLYRMRSKDVAKSKNSDLRELYSVGMGVHHAGMLRSDRNLSESLFKQGLVRVLCCTATLAWGVNLPAATVVIKGTEIYNPEKGGMREVGVLDVQQIFGRAGRPQYKENGEATIITKQPMMSRYLGMLTHQTPIESQYIESLADNLNAEVAAGTVTSVKEAVTWLSYTYLHVRMRRNPMAYGVSYEERSADPQLRNKRVELVQSAARHLDDCRMLRYDARSGNLGVTDLGRVASHFYLKSETIAHFNTHLKPEASMMMADVFDLVCGASELDQVRVRDDELKELDMLKKKAQVRPIRGGIENTPGKCNALLQAYVSNLFPKQFTLFSDMMYVAQNAGRIARGLFEICLRKGWPDLAEMLLMLTKAIDKQLWWEPICSPLRQFTAGGRKGGRAVGLPLELVRKLEIAHMSLDDLCDMEPQEIGQLLRHKRIGDKVAACVSYVPYLHLNVEVQPLTRTVLRVNIDVSAAFTWNDKAHGNSGSEPFWIWVLDSERAHIYHSEYLVMDKKTCVGTMKGTVDPISLVFTVPVYEPVPKQYYIRVLSDRWLGSSQSLTISFKNLTLPRKQSPPTDLLNLAPLPVSALQNPAFQNLFRFTHFNPLQTQAFYALYHNTDENVLLCSPTGSGKTVACELALLALKRDQPNGKVAYLAPMKALARERLKDWTDKFAPLGMRVAMLTGDVTPNIRTLAASDIIITTPEKWDGVTRSWRDREYVRQTKLVIIDEIHLLGEDRGPVLESVVSRVRYVSEQLIREQKHTPSTTQKQGAASRCRIVGLSTALANADDLASWLGCKSNASVFNFRPSVRPVPIEVHLAGFPGKHYCPRMQTMNKPTFAAIDRYSPFKPVLVFVSSRRQTRLTAFELINYCTQDDNPYRFLMGSNANPNENTRRGSPQEDMDAVCATVRDQALRRSLAFGIGIHHGGLSLHDRKTAESLFLEGKIQVLVCTATLAWGVNLPAHLVVLKGTEFFDGKTSRYVDYPITDVLQMMGRAGRPQFDDKGVACILVHEPKKNFYRKFLYEPFPVESQLLKADHVLYDQLNAEIATGSVTSKSDAINYLTWTFMWRRLVQNPSFYGLEDTSDEGVLKFLLNLIDAVFAGLHRAHCADVLDDDVSPLPCGRIASRYYISYRTVHMFRDRLTSDVGNATPASDAAHLDDALLEPLLRILADSPEFDEVPVRHNEDELCGELAKFCPWRVDSLALDDPHTKTFLLLQAKHQGIHLPIQDFVTDTASVVQQMPRLVQALRAIAMDVVGASRDVERVLKKYAASIERPRRGEGRERQRQHQQNTTKAHRQQRKAHGTKTTAEDRRNGGNTKPRNASNPARVGAELTHLLPSGKRKKNTKKKRLPKKNKK